MAKKSVAQALVEELEAKYQAVKHGEAEILHNSIVAAIGEHRPDAQTLLFVLEMVKFETLTSKFSELFMQGGRAPMDIKSGGEK